MDVSSFADLLQRVIRRGAATRGFADLGSGRGHAVLTAPWQRKPWVLVVFLVVLDHFMMS